MEYLFIGGSYNKTRLNVPIEHSVVKLQKREIASEPRSATQPIKSHIEIYHRITMRGEHKLFYFYSIEGMSVDGAFFEIFYNTKE